MGTAGSVLLVFAGLALLLPAGSAAEENIVVNFQCVARRLPSTFQSCKSDRQALPFSIMGLLQQCLEEDGSHNNSSSAQRGSIRVADGSAGALSLFMEQTAQKYAQVTGWENSTFILEELPINQVDQIKAMADEFTSSFNASKSYDGWLVRAAYFGEGQQAHAVQDLTQLVLSDPALQWSGNSEVVRQVISLFGGKIITLPLSPVPFFMYYRRDIFEKYNWSIPATMDEYMALLPKINGTDWDGDGVPEFATCGYLDSRCGWDAFFATRYMAAHQQTMGPAQGTLMDPVTLEGLTNSAMFARSMGFVMTRKKYGPTIRYDLPADCKTESDGILRAMSNCLTTFGTILVGKLGSSNQGNPTNNMANRGKIGVAPWPGTTLVLDRKTMNLTTCTPAICPYAQRLPDGRLVNQPVQFTSQVLAISSKAPLLRKLRTYGLFSYMSSPGASDELVAAYNFMGGPTRESQFNLTRFVEIGGYDLGDAKAMLDAARWAISNPNNVVFDGRYPGATALFLNIVNTCLAYLRSNIAAPVAAAQMNQMMADLRDKYPGGPAAWKEIYQQSLNYVPPPTMPPPPASSPATPQPTSGGESKAKVLAITLPICIGVLLLAVLGWVAVYAIGRRKRETFTQAPPPGPLTTVMVTDIQDSTPLWEALPPEVMDRVVDMHHRCIRLALLDNKGYECVTEGDSFIVAFANPTLAAACALQIQTQLLALDWPAELLTQPSCLEVHAEPVGSLFGVGSQSGKLRQGSKNQATEASTAAPSSSTGLAMGVRSLMKWPSTLSQQPSMSGPSVGMTLRSAGNLGQGSSSGIRTTQGGAPGLTSWIFTQATNNPARVFNSVFGSGRFRASSFKASTSNSGAAGQQGGQSQPTLTKIASMSSLRRTSRPTPMPQALMHMLSGRSEWMMDGATPSGPGQLMRQESNTLNIAAASAADRQPPSPSMSGALMGPMTGGTEELVDAEGEQFAAAEEPVAWTGVMLSPLRENSQLSNEPLPTNASAPFFGGPPPGVHMVSGQEPDAAPDMLYHQSSNAFSQRRTHASFSFTAGFGPRTLTDLVKSAWRAGPPQVRGQWSKWMRKDSGRMGSMVPGGPAVVLRGLRVRIGLHSGFYNPVDVHVNRMMLRTIFGGFPMLLAKAVGDAAPGGMVLMSGACKAGLDLKALATSWPGCLLVYMGRYMMKQELPPADLYQLLSGDLLPRIALLGQLRTQEELIPGVLATPMGDLAAAEVQLVGLQAIEEWHDESALHVLDTFEDMCIQTLAVYGGFPVQVQQGVAIALFHNDQAALLWAAAVMDCLKHHDWPQGLLQHELCEEIWIAAPSHMQRQRSGSAQSMVTPTNSGSRQQSRRGPGQPVVDVHPSSPAHGEIQSMSDTPTATATIDVGLYRSDNMAMDPSSQPASFTASMVVADGSSQQASTALRSASFPRPPWFSKCKAAGVRSAQASPPGSPGCSALQTIPSSALHVASQPTSAASVRATPRGSQSMQQVLIAGRSLSAATSSMSGPGSLKLLFRGPRLKAAVHCGETQLALQPHTGRLALQGQLRLVLTQLLDAARSGDILTSKEIAARLGTSVQHITQPQQPINGGLEPTSSARGSLVGGPSTTQPSCPSGVAPSTTSPRPSGGASVPVHQSFPGNAQHPHPATRKSLRSFRAACAKTLGLAALSERALAEPAVVEAAAAAVEAPNQAAGRRKPAPLDIVAVQPDSPRLQHSPHGQQEGEIQPVLAAEDLEGPQMSPFARAPQQLQCVLERVDRRWGGRKEVYRCSVVLR